MILTIPRLASSSRSCIPAARLRRAASCGPGTESSRSTRSTSARSLTPRRRRRSGGRRTRSVGDGQNIFSTNANIFCTNINIFEQMQILLCVQVTVCWERTGEGGTTEDITVTIARRPGRGLGLSVVGRRDGPGQLPLVTTSNTGLLLVQVRTHELILVCYWCRSLHLGPGAGGRGGGGGQPAPRGPDHQGQ